MRNTLSYMFAAVILVGAGAGIMFNAAYAGHAWAIWHHEDQGRPSDVTFERCMPVEEQNGHARHEGDYEVGPCEEEPDDPTATLEPTPTPTDTPEPTPTPTDEPQPTPTPTDEDCGGECDPAEVPTPTPTDPPTVEPTPTATELPQTGDGDSTEAWLCWSENVYCSHNGVEGSEGEMWVFYYVGKTFEFRGQTYIVQAMERVTPDMVQSLDDAVNYDIVLTTCSNYIGGVWVNRVIIFANLSE